MRGYRIGVISDTHGLLRGEVFELFEGVDLILHGGDVGRDELLVELAAIAPVRAVTGNVDGHPTADRPLEQRLETPLGRIAMAHGHLPEAPSTDLKKMAAHFAEFGPKAIVYGHSHIPKLERVGGVWLFNPGAAGRGRFGRGPTVGLIEAAEEGEAEAKTAAGGRGEGSGVKGLEGAVEGAGGDGLRFTHKTLTA